MGRIEAAIALACRGLAAVGCLGMVLTLAHVSVDVFCRYVLDVPLGGTLEWVAGYYMVAIALLPLGYVALVDGHIMVDLFTRGLGERPRARIDAVVAALGFAFLAVVAWRGLLEAVRNTVEQEAWETAAGVILMWPSRWMVPVGFAGMAAVFLLRAVRRPGTRTPSPQP